MEKRIHLFLSLLILTVILLNVGCKKKKEEQKSTELHKLDIADMQFLTVLPIQPKNLAMGLDTYSPQTMYKVTTTGEIKEVTHLNISGEEIPTTIAPQGICNLDETYILIVSKNNKIYLLRKSDGVVFEIKSESNAPSHFHIIPEAKLLVRKDGNNNIYFIADTFTARLLYKVNISNPENLTTTVISPPNENMRFFDVDLSGNILYSSNDQSTGATIYYRLKKANGTTEAINSSFYLACIASNDKFYIGDTINNTSLNIKEITIDNDFNTSYSNFGTYPVNHTNYYYEYRLMNGDKNIFVAEDRIRVFDPSNGFNTYAIPVTNISNAYNTSDFLYIAGNGNGMQGGLFKMSHNSYNSYSNPVSASTYCVYKVAVASDGSMIFSALRISDTKNVLIRIDNNGNETVLMEGLEPQTVVLQAVL